MTKELFIETIEALAKQYEHDERCKEAFEVILPNDFITGYDNHLLTNQIVKILQVEFNDESLYSWIEYYLYELDFGRKPGCVTRKDGSEIDLSTPGDLYDLLLERNQIKTRN